MHDLIGSLDNMHVWIHMISVDVVTTLHEYFLWELIKDDVRDLIKLMRLIP